MKLPIKKADPSFYEKVGKYIELWLKENSGKHAKPGTGKELAYMLNKTPAQISRWIHGINQMPAEIMARLMNMHGFNNKYYDEYIANKNGYSLEHLTKEDLFRLIRELQLLAEKYQVSMFHYSDRAGKFSQDNHQLVMQMSRLIEENDKLRKETSQLRKQLKKEG